MHLEELQAFTSAAAGGEGLILLLGLPGSHPHHTRALERRQALHTFLPPTLTWCKIKVPGDWQTEIHW